MPFLDINLIAVLAASLISLGAGALWQHIPPSKSPSLANEGVWGSTHPDASDMSRHTINVLATLLVAYTLAYVMALAGVASVEDALSAAFLVWGAFFGAAVIRTAKEQKPLASIAKSATYHLVSLSMMATVLILFSL